MVFAFLIRQLSLTGDSNKGHVFVILCLRTLRVSAGIVYMIGPIFIIIVSQLIILSLETRPSFQFKSLFSHKHLEYQKS